VWPNGPLMWKEESRRTLPTGVLLFWLFVKKTGKVSGCFFLRHHLTFLNAMETLRRIFLFLAICHFPAIYFFMLQFVTNNPFVSSLWCEIWPLIILIVSWAQSLSCNYIFCVVWHRGGCGNCVCHQWRHYLCRSISSSCQPTAGSLWSTSTCSCKGPLGFILSARATFLTENLDEFSLSAWSSTARDTLKPVCFSYICPCVLLKCLSKWPLKVFGHLGNSLKWMNVISWDNKMSNQMAYILKKANLTFKAVSHTQKCLLGYKC